MGIDRSGGGGEVRKWRWWLPVLVVPSRMVVVSIDELAMLTCMCGSSSHSWIWYVKPKVLVLSQGC